MSHIRKHGKGKKKGSRNQSSTGGSSISLDRRTRKGEALRLVTLSWEKSDLDLGVTEFLETIRAWRARDTGVYDLVICAGRTLEKDTSSANILAASDGVSVLYEVWKGETATWCVAHESQGGMTLTVIRDTQLVRKRSSEIYLYDALATTLAHEKGVIRFNDFSLPFILFICGENNALEYCGLNSVLWRSSNTLAPPKVLCSDWVALNPAHNPYSSPIARTGFAKIAKTSSGQGPTLGKLVKNNVSPYRDKTLAPLAVIHVNNFCPGNTLTEKHASVVFARDNTVIADYSESITGTLSDGLQWRYATYSVGEPRGRHYAQGTAQITQ